MLDYDVKDEFRNNKALYYAILEDKYEVAVYLIQRGIELNTRGTKSWTPFLMSCNKKERMKYLKLIKLI